MTDDRCQEMHLLIQADLDGELTPAETVRVANHLDACPECRAMQEDLARLSVRVRTMGLCHQMPAALHASVQARIAAEAGPDRRPRARTAWSPRAGYGRVLSFGSGFALAACLTWAIVLPGPDGGLTEAVVSDHIRSLQPGHLMDVVSTDQHTVKPWFDGRLAFAPVVRDFRVEGFPLAGGRLDYLGGREVAALVYRRDQHVIQVFVWPGGSALGPGIEAGSRSGYNFVRWTQGGMAYWAVSDLNEAELSSFVRLWQGV